MVLISLFSSNTFRVILVMTFGEWFPSTMSCVWARNLSILWNGAIVDNFKPSRGLRQKYLLSSNLFSCCMEKLDMTIQEKVNHGISKLLHISKDGPWLSHLQFSDDVLLFVMRHQSKLKLWWILLMIFSKPLDWKWNWQRQTYVLKGSQIVSKGSWRIFLLLILLLILNTLWASHSCKVSLPYKHILKKMHTRLAAWKGSLLNKARRVCMAMSVTISLHIYTMKIHNLPQNIWDSVDHITKNFIYGGNGTQRKWNMVKWTTFTTPKKNGELAIRDTRLSNLALFGNFVGNLLHANKLWVRVMNHKYL